MQRHGDTSTDAKEKGGEEEEFLKQRVGNYVLLG
jgi:hypothetical protein